LAKRIVLALQNREVALDKRGVCEGRHQATAERPEMNEGFGEQIAPSVVEHCLVRVAIDARLERRQTAAHRDKSAVFVLNAIDPLLAPRRHQHLAPWIEDVLYELARSHLYQLLREHGRGKLCGDVVAEVALGLYNGQAEDEVQRVQGDFAQQVELVVLIEG